MPIESGNVDVLEFDDLGSPLGVRTVGVVVKTAAEWKAQLSAQQYYVTRQGSTDTPYSGTYHSLHSAGIYRCVCCGTALFRSEDKFDSGTGWPSFAAPADERNVRTRKDTSMFVERVEVACRRCEAHLGHVFPDGPEPAHLRYCINESALRFIKSS
ncbi:MAG: peptide-methionine (R)-S-oxide reductase MsrB [Acidobacteria bacterium]|nr:peptide-methionine (R)-S-oxide reductase MsrB [Acidobacteriota bacterium]